ncbi:helix-turn-helix transcriptional regulator [Streptomyces sp. 4.24]|uniref:helix-turn-helix transcriptional regulator n=1 Tax=Streptomyces tritrimontium TaxID=3406573 RepID=UPI003BB6A957
MPNTPEEKGDRELLTMAQIMERFDISRTTLHSLRKRGQFPPSEVEPGSTRQRWDAVVVAAYFEAHPKRPGRRTDLEDPADTPKP